MFIAIKSVLLFLKTTYFYLYAFSLSNSSFLQLVFTKKMLLQKTIFSLVFPQPVLKYFSNIL